MRNLNLKKALGLAAMLASASAVVAPAAASVTVNFQMASLDKSTLTATGVGQKFTITSDLFVTAYAWNASPVTNGRSTTYSITTAQLGDYYGGLGVTSGDANDNIDRNQCGLGDCGSHQIDNLGDAANSKSYDFVQLVFTDKAGNAVNVNISSLERTAWGTANASLNSLTYDDDFSIGAGGTVSNNSSIASLTSLFSANYGDVGTCTADQSTSGVRYCDDTTTITGNAAASTWYVAASVAPGGYGADSYVDGLKIKALTLAVVPPAAVPEPATWGMMILGFGLTGTAIRRSKARVAFAKA